MSARHTPGPWEYSGDRFDESVWKPRGDGSFARIAYADVCFEFQPERDAARAMRVANAKLIAAAPELLSALIGMLDIASVWETIDGRKNIQLDASDSVKAARAAIAKARGNHP